MKHFVFGLILIGLFSTSAEARCVQDGGEWVGPGHDVTTYNPHPNHETYTTSFRICRFRMNDDLLRVYWHSGKDYNGIGFSSNVGHGKNSLTQVVMFPWRDGGWERTPFVVQLQRGRSGWRITAMDAMLGENRASTVRKLTRNKVYRHYGFQ